MIAPTNTTLTDYSKVFKVSVLSAEDMSTARGLYQRHRTLQESEQQSYEADNLGFSWQVSTHNSSCIEI